VGSNEKPTSCSLAKYVETLFVLLGKCRYGMSENGKGGNEWVGVGRNGFFFCKCENERKEWAGVERRGKKLNEVGELI